MSLRWLRHALLAVAATGLAGTLRAADLSLASGPAVVVDASHLDVAGRRFKLYGIDAPDLDETCNDADEKEYACGIEARNALAGLVAGAAVSCLPRGPNENAEALGVCSVGSGDVAQAMIAKGWAIADRTRTLYYEKAEEDARLTKLGLWQGRFVPPVAWRLGERVPQSRSGGNKASSPGKLF